MVYLDWGKKEKSLEDEKMQQTWKGKFLGFKPWFTKYYSISDAIEDIEIVKETEKACKILFIIRPKFGNNFQDWVPKAAIVTEESYLEEQARKAAAIEAWRKKNPEKAAAADAKYKLMQLKSKWSRRLTRIKNQIKATEEFNNQLEIEVAKIDKNIVGWLPRTQQARDRVFEQIARVWIKNSTKFSDQEKDELFEVLELR